LYELAVDIIVVVIGIVIEDEITTVVFGAVVVKLELVTVLPVIADDDSNNVVAVWPVLIIDTVVESLASADVVIIDDADVVASDCTEIVELLASVDE
jgi:hypothetical protein